VIWQSQLRQRSFGDAEFFEGLDLVEQFERVGLPGEQVLIGADEPIGRAIRLISRQFPEPITSYDPITQFSVYQRLSIFVATTMYMSLTPE
jgi:hypothetical protein